MKKQILFVFLVLVGLVAVGCQLRLQRVSKITPGTVHEFTVRDQGFKRVYLVYVPSSYSKETPTPLVLNLHGGAGSAEGQMNMTDMNTLAEQEGFIVTYPGGTGVLPSQKLLLVWNAGACCSLKDTKVDDVAFIEKLLNDLDKKLNIDKKRTYSTGISNGGMMSQRLACELSEKIAAVASVVGTLGLDACNPSRAVPIMQIQGQKDPCIPYQGGGECGGCFAKLTGIEPTLWSCQPVEKINNDWLNRNGCTNQKVTRAYGNVLCHAYSNCQGESEVVLFDVVDGGHRWPGDKEILPQAYYDVVGLDTSNASANEIIWEFFQKHSL